MIPKTLRLLFVVACMAIAIVSFSAFTAPPAQASSAVTHVTPAYGGYQYERGFRDGKREAHYACEYSRYRPHYLRHYHYESPYRAGFVDGWDYVIRFECHHRH